MALLQFDFSGDTLAKMEAYERAVLSCESNSGKTVPELFRIGMVMNRIQDNELATHLLLNSERLKTWAAFRKEVIHVAQARAAASGAYAVKLGKRDTGGAMPMDVDGLNSQKRCDNCGRLGHVKKDCWELGGGASDSKG